MATDKIKGLTVKIGADTSDFIKEIKKVDKEISATQRTANELQKGLELEFDNKRFLQTQKQVRNALTETEAKAKAIRSQLKYLEDTGGINTEGYARLQTELAKTETNALKLKKQLDDIEKIKFENATKGISNLSNGLEKAAKKTAAFSLAATAAIAGIYKLGSDAAKTGGDLQDMADRLGVSAEALQKYDYIALQSGVDTEQLVKSMAKARDAIGTALAGGTNTATQALQELFGDIKKVPTNTEEGFNAIIEQLAKVEDSTLQAYYANEIFGERLATNLIPLINNGADKLNKFAQEFESIGYLSNEQVQALADFDDELNIMRERLELAKTELGIAMIPLLENFAQILENVIVPAIQSLSEWFGNLPEPMQSIITGALLLVAGLSPVLLILSKITGAIPTLIKMFGKLKGASLSTSFGIAALAAGLGLVFDLIGNWSQMTTLEKVLKSLALAALVAAAAITVFHASWSLGIAVGVITAAVVAGIAAINSAGKSIGVDTNFSDTSGIGNAAQDNYNIPTGNGAGNTYNEDNSQYNINVNLNATGELGYDAKALADEVIKQIVVAKQSSGR